MRNVYFDYLDHRYRLIVRDDHAALIYCDDHFLTSIWPFCSEKQDEEILIKSAKEAIDQTRSVNPSKEPPLDD